MLNLRPVLLINGVLLMVLAAAMLVAFTFDFFFSDKEWQAFLVSAFLCGFTGGLLFLSNRGYSGNLNLRQAFLSTASSWFVLPFFAGFPFIFSSLSASVTDAYFESASGLTTTGSTVFTGLDNMSHGLLLWRCLIQGLGGVGVIVLAMAILPALSIGGMQLFRTESSDRTDKVIPRAGEMAKVIGITFATLVALCALSFWFGGMSGFDAICHALTTLSSGGFANYDASFGHFQNAELEMICTFFMLCGGMPMIMYFQMLHGKPLAFFHDTQVRWFLSIFALVTLLLTVWMCLHEHFDPLTALRLASFNVASVITTTGYASTDYTLWGTGAILIFFMLTVVGGCTGSTAGGIKIFRFKVLYEVSSAQLSRLVQPHGVFIPRYQGKPIPEDASAAVLSFFTLFAFCFLVLATLLSFFDLDFITSMSAAAQALANVGPGLGNIVGPAGNYQTLPDGAKWLIAIGMIIGRLELFTVLVMLTRQFWRD